MSSTASEAFRKCSADLIKAIQDQDLLVLAWELFSAGIASKPVLEGLSALGLSPVEKKTRLLNAVGNKIDVDPAKFHNFLQVLREQPPLKDVVDKLEITYKRCGSSSLSPSGNHSSLQSARATSHPHLLQQATSTPELRKLFALESQETITVRFAALQMKVCKRLSVNGVDTQEVRLFVINQFPPGDHIPPPSASLSEVFEAITYHGLWDYNHYSPLVRIVRAFGAEDTEMESWVQAYKKDLKAYLLVTTVEDYIEADLDVCHPPPVNCAKYDCRYYCPVELKLDESFVDHTLRYLADVWEMFSGRCLVPDSPPTALLDRVRKGCFSVTWLIPSSLVLSLAKRIEVNTDFLEEHRIIRVTVGDKCVYEETNPPGPEGEIIGGFDCQFVKPPSPVLRTECPVCRLILCDPHQTKCCGTNFCHSCIQKVKADKNPCPNCRKVNFEFFQDMGLQRSLTQLHVLCTHRDCCKWTGELGNLKHHWKKVHSGTDGKVSKPFSHSSVGDYDLDDHCPPRVITLLLVLAGVALAAIIVGRGFPNSSEISPKRFDCSIRKQLHNGSVSYYGTEYSMVIVHKCDEGYSLIGSSTRVCQSSGKWSGKEPFCEPVQCFELKDPMHGQVELKERTFHSKARYVCNNGFYLVGDEYRMCQSSGSWSGNAAYCESSQERYTNETVFSVLLYQKINRVQQIARQLENAFIAHALEIISINVGDGRLQAGVVGLLKSGKSTTLNALMKTRLLPDMVQPETAADVRIVHSTKEGHKYGLLLDDRNNETASGSDEIYKKLRQYNEMARKGEWLPHDSLTLRIPLPFLREHEFNFSLEIYDTAGPEQAGSTDATLKSLSTMERLSVFIIILNYRRMKSQQEIDLLTHLQNYHPQLLETHDRFLFVVNAIDAYYEDGDKNSLHPKDVREYVQIYLQERLHVKVPTERIVLFSAKWALRSHLWSKDARHLSYIDYISALTLFAKIQNKDLSKNMYIFSLENKKVVASHHLGHLKDFSGIGELEQKLYQMLGINGPVILYKGAIDDTTAHISTLKKHIKGEKVKCNITATTTALHLHEQLSEHLSERVKTNQQRMHKLSKQFHDNLEKSIHRWATQKDLSEKVYSSSEVYSPLTNREDQIPVYVILENTWSNIMSNVMKELRGSVVTLFSALKGDIEKIAKTHNIKLVLDELNFGKLPEPSKFNLHVSIPSEIEPLMVSALQKRDTDPEWAVRFYKITEAEINKLSTKSFRMAEEECLVCVEKLQKGVVEKIKVLRQELEAKQKHIESLNQMVYQLDTVHQQLLGVREEFQFADEEEEQKMEAKNREDGSKDTTTKGETNII